MATAVQDWTRVFGEEVDRILSRLNQGNLLFQLATEHDDGDVGPPKKFLGPIGNCTLRDPGEGVLSQNIV